MMGVEWMEEEEEEEKADKEEKTKKQGSHNPFCSLFFSLMADG